jgi:hypothetical protein
MILYPSPQKQSGDEESGAQPSKMKTDTALAVALVVIALIAMGGTIYLLYRLRRSRKAERRQETSMASIRSFIMPINMAQASPISVVSRRGAGNTTPISTRQNPHVFRTATSPWVSDAVTPRRVPTIRPAIRPRPGNFFQFSFQQKASSSNAQLSTGKRPFTLKVAPGAPKSNIGTAALSLALPYAISPVPRAPEQTEANNVPSEQPVAPSEPEPQPQRTRLISPPAQLSAKIQGKREAGHPSRHHPALSQPLPSSELPSLTSPHQPSFNPQSPSISHPYSSPVVSDRPAWLIQSNPTDSRHRRKLTVSTALAALGVERASALFDPPEEDTVEPTATTSAGHSKNPSREIHTPVPLSATGRTLFPFASRGQAGAIPSDNASEALVSAQSERMTSFSADTSSTIGNIGSEISTIRQQNVIDRWEERNMKANSSVSGRTFGHKRSSSETRLAPIGRTRLRPLTLITLSRSPPPPPYTPEDENPSVQSTPVATLPAQPVPSSSKARDPGMTAPTKVPSVILPPRAHVKDNRLRNVNQSPQGEIFFTRPVLGPSRPVQDQPMPGPSNPTSPRDLPSLPSTAESAVFPKNWPAPPTTSQKERTTHLPPLEIPQSPKLIDMIVSASHIPEHFLVDD